MAWEINIPLGSRIYKKLLGARGSIGSRFSLWLGPDHVLLVEANMMTERYQRVWLRDIQGFLVRPSREARWATGIGAGLMLIFGALALLMSNAAAPVFWTLFAICTPILIYGFFGARNCHFYAVTAVQRTEWTNVVRRRQVRKILARLEPLIREAQRVEPESMSASGPASVADSGTVPAAGVETAADFAAQPPPVPVSKAGPDANSPAPADA